MKQRPHARLDAGGDEEDAFFTVDYTTQKNLPKQFNKNKANRGNMRRVRHQQGKKSFFFFFFFFF
jgi:hypothetical protein